MNDWTNPAALKSHIDARMSDMRLLGVVVVIAVLAVMLTMNAGNSKATRVALAASDAKGVAHNGLIERMREMSDSYLTKGNVISFLSAAAMCGAVYVAFIK